MQKRDFVALNICVLVASDTRDETSDKSSAYLAEQAQDTGHVVAEKKIVKDNIYKIREVVSSWIANDSIHAIIITGGTGFASTDVTIEAVQPLFDKEALGFGELFRSVSAEVIGSATIQTRSTAGTANNTVIFCLPGSTGACKQAWEQIIKQQLDNSNRPCNFAMTLLKK